MKTVKHILCVLVLLLVIAVAAVVFLFGPNYKAASSVRKLAEGVYYYEYEGNDGFDKMRPKPRALSSTGFCFGAVVFVIIISFIKNTSLYLN